MKGQMLPKISAPRRLRAAAALLVALALAPSGCDKTPEPKGDNTAGATATLVPRPSASAPPASPGAGEKGPSALDGNAPIFHPELAIERAPEVYKAKFTTTKGDFVIEVHRDWAPNGADRFYNLVKLGFFDGVKFFRAVENFMVQFGISGDPRVNGAWYRASITDDPVKKSNKRGFVTFATSGPHSRSTQVFINYSDANARLDKTGFAPFGQVVEGMKVVDSLYKGYGEGAPMGKGPDQGRVQSEGNKYLEKEFPLLDAVKEAKILLARRGVPSGRAFRAGRSDSRGARGSNWPSPLALGPRAHPLALGPRTHPPALGPRTHPSGRGVVEGERRLIRVSGRGPIAKRH
ncbi:MAG TPA: peptidylprolyl isomerase [Polyangiaceae bacterium]|nr:peptidylprolyl isomerase [Polyangiaceae bacterium]